MRKMKRTKGEEDNGGEAGGETYTTSGSSPDEGAAMTHTKSFYFEGALCEAEAANCDNTTQQHAAVGPESAAGSHPSHQTPRHIPHHESGAPPK